MLDGSVLAEKGRAGTALETALKSSTVGGIISCLALLLFALVIAKAAFGLTIIVGVIGNSPVKGLIGVMVGLMASTIGLDPIGGLPRMTFAITRLTAGIQLVPALIGLFAISELMAKITRKANEVEQ
jgi:putative tricarboxylic transport membrane protein